MNRTRKTITEVLGIWVCVQSPRVNYGEFAAIKSHKPLEFEGVKQARLKRLKA